MQLEREKKSVNGLGIASLVFGIVGILTICMCGIGFFFGLIGIILGILGLTVLKNSGKGFPVAGLIVSGIAFVFGSFWMFLYIPRHSGKQSNQVVSTSTQNTTSTTSSSTSSKETDSSKDEKPSTSNSSSYNYSYPSSNYSYSDAKEELSDTWDDLKDSVSDAFWDGVWEALSEDDSSETPSSSSGTSSSSSQVSPELKEFCDSYEDLMDQYCKVLEAMDKDSNEYMEEYVDLIEKMYYFEDKTEYYDTHKDEMSEADLAYYTACMERISLKLMKTSVKMSN